MRLPVSGEADADGGETKGGKGQMAAERLPLSPIDASKHQQQRQTEQYSRLYSIDAQQVKRETVRIACVGETGRRGKEGRAESSKLPVSDCGKLKKTDTCAHTVDVSFYVRRRGACPPARPHSLSLSTRRTLPADVNIIIPVV